MNLTFFLATSSSTPVTHAVHYGLLVIYFVIRNTPSRTICKSSRLSSSYIRTFVPFLPPLGSMTLDHHHHQRWSFLSPSMCHPPRWLSRLEFLVGQRRSWSPLYLNISFATITIRRSQHHRHHHHHMLCHNQDHCLIRIIIIAVSTFPSFERRRSVRSLVACHGQWDNGAEEGQQWKGVLPGWRSRCKYTNTQIFV